MHSTVQADGPRRPSQILRRAGRSLAILGFAVTVLAANVYQAFFGLLLLLQSHMIFVPLEHLGHTPADFDATFEDLSVPTPDGETLHGWYVHTSQVEKPRGTILYCHGNAGNIGHRASMLPELLSHGYDVVMFDYRGFGHSSGSPSEQGIYRDLHAMWGHLTHERAIDPHSIVLWGRSLGGAMAVYLATEVAATEGAEAPRALILEATFTSIPDTAANRYWMYPVRLIARTQLASIDRVGAIKIPLLHAHSHEDGLVPYAQGRALYAASGSRDKTFVDLHGPHNIAKLSETRYHERVAEFFGSLPTP